MSDPSRPMDLETYRRLVRALPPLTRAQRDAFPQWVGDAHSWYKRIRLLGRGKRFVLFLDPAAGCDRRLEPDGWWEVIPRAVRGFHYSAIPTKAYREQFGHLAFASGQSLRAGSFIGGVLRIETGIDATVIDESGVCRHLPEEIEGGAIRLSGMIHQYANQYAFWQSLAKVEPVPGIWPEESGGAVVFEQIQRRCRELVGDRSKRVDDPMGRGHDLVFADLVEPGARGDDAHLRVCACEQRARVVPRGVIDDDDLPVYSSVVLSEDGVQALPGDGVLVVDRDDDAYPWQSREPWNQGCFN